MRAVWSLLLHPRHGIPDVLAHPPSGRWVLGFLGIVGLLRGLLEAAWLFGMAYRPGMLERILAEAPRHLWEGALFVAANVMTAYLRWAMYTLLVVGVARWFGGQVRDTSVRTLVALMLGLYVVPVLVNSLYLVMPLPSVRFAVSAVYQPVIGLGQLVGSVWLAWIAFHIFRQVCGLRRSEAFLGAVFIPLLDRVLFVAGAAVVFSVRQLAWMPVTARMSWVTIGFLGVAVVAAPLLLRISHRLGEQRRIVGSSYRPVVR